MLSFSAETSVWFRKYKDLCRPYQCTAKVISKMGGTLKNRLGSPDLLVMFTDTISHKLAQNALNETRGQDTVIVRSRPSSMSALGSILAEHAGARA